ncbi:MAG: NAD(P)/FAD-dependent oxidoreductase, partial [Chloroflexota bacterium]
LFQPLLYQVATGGLSPGDISSPLRAVLSGQQNTTVLQAEAVDIDPGRRRVVLRDGEISYDSLIVASGVSHHYFGRDEWAGCAPGLKTIEDALDIRRRILLAFEAAEREPESARRRACLTFVIVGGGPTGVELAGAIAELARTTLKDDFRRIDPTEARVLLLEGQARLLPSYPSDLAAKAAEALKKLGVTVQTGSLVADIQDQTVVIKRGEQLDQLQSRTILWAAGMKASALGQALANRTGVKLDRAGRVMVEPDLSLSGEANIFVIGDLAHLKQNGQPLPGVAQVAMQQGQYVARLIRQRLAGQALPPFHYHDRGSMAVIGRNAAVAVIGKLQLWGYPAWLIWVFIHIAYLIEFDNRLLVLVQWAWNYFTRKRGARLITGADPFPLVEEKITATGIAQAARSASKIGSAETTTPRRK